jgi:hypothetical protein
MQALCERFVVAYGSADPSRTGINQWEAGDFCNIYWSDSWGFNAAISAVDEASLTASDIASSHIVLFGCEEDSALLARMCSDPSLPFHLPARILAESITIGEDVFAGAEYGIWMVYPNPLAPDKLVVVGHNVIGHTDGLYGILFWTRDAWSWQWPDYVVCKTDKPVRNEVTLPTDKYPGDQYMIAGHFTRDWEPPDGTTRVTQVLVEMVPASYVKGSLADAHVRATLTDETGAALTGIPHEAFRAYVDGEPRPVDFAGDPVSFEEPDPVLQPGVYEADVDISDLVVAPSNARYDLTVEVVRQVASELVVGRGRGQFEIQ